MRTHSETLTASNGARVEQGTVIISDRPFVATGSVIDTEQGVIIGYPSHGGPNGPHTLRTWAGEAIGALTITGQARGFHGTKLTCYAMTYEGRRYSGRGLGDGMSVRLRARKTG